MLTDLGIVVKRAMVMAGMGFAEQLIEGSLENYRVGTPLRKNAQVEDIAAATLFLLSDQAAHVTMRVAPLPFDSDRTPSR